MHVEDVFKQQFNKLPVIITRAPGRLELLGNHTDYNQGFVISCATDASTYFAALPKNGTICRLYSAVLGSAKIDLADLKTPKKGEWVNYIKGIMVELQNRGYKVSAYDAVVTSEIPLSHGMSSSAALEMAAAYAIGKMNNIDLSPEEWAQIGQACENNYIGANTGLLDQLTSVMAEKDRLLLIDFRDWSVEKLTFPEGVSIVVANSGVSHDLTKEYNDRRRRCEEAAGILTDIYDGSHLRDITLDQLIESQDKLDHLSYLRALHVIGENHRVIRAKDAFSTNNLEKIGKLFEESHESSRKNFENSCRELDILSSCGKVLSGYYGSRLSGGGFGGISIHLVKNEDAAKYCQRLATAFEIETGRKPDTMICTIGQGAEIYV